MQASRTYAAGLGATGVLVAACVFLLVVAGGLVAFKGWPHGGLADDVGSLVVGHDSQALQLSGPQRVASASAGAARGVAAVPARGGAPAGTPGGPGTKLAAATPPPASGDGGNGAPGTGFDGGATPPSGFGNGGGAGGKGSAPAGPPAAGGTPLPDVRSPSLARDVTQTLGDTTDSLTTGLGTTIGRLNRPLGDTVTNTGRGVSGVIRRVGGN